MNKKLIIALIILALIAHRLILKRIIKNYAEKLEKSSNHYFYNNPNWSETRQNTIANWRESGNSRRPRKTILKSLENLEDEEFIEENYIEENEFPKTLNEAFKGLEDDEINDILDMVLQQEDVSDKE